MFSVKVLWPNDPKYKGPKFTERLGLAQRKVQLIAPKWRRWNSTWDNRKPQLVAVKWGCHTTPTN